MKVRLFFSTFLLIFRSVGRIFNYFKEVLCLSARRKPL